MDELKDLVVVVTGSGKGLGKGIAESCYAEGAKIVTWDRSGAAKAVADTLDPSGKRTLYVQADAVNEAQVVKAFEQVVQQFGRVDVLVNNAGISRHKPIEEMTLELFEEVMRINVTGLFLCCKAVVPIMKKQGRGKIVNISSLAARAGRPGVGVNYAASKAGVISITQTLAREVGPAGIYVNAIAPGPILTEQTRQYPPEVFAKWNTGRAVQKDGLPEDVGDAVIFLASKRSDWITGVTLDINGGIVIR
jgi:3-oxoacyl-[acyl-carrier protein] reductase